MAAGFHPNISLYFLPLPCPPPLHALVRSEECLLRAEGSQAFSFPPCVVLLENAREEGERECHSARITHKGHIMQNSSVHLLLSLPPAS